MQRISLTISFSFVIEDSLQGIPGPYGHASAVIALAHDMKFEVIAEGVETEEQLRFLNERGCHAVQGYFVSKPLPAKSFMEWLAVNNPN